MSLENSLPGARVRDSLDMDVGEVGLELNFQGGDLDKDVISGRNQVPEPRYSQRKGK